MNAEELAKLYTDPLSIAQFPTEAICLSRALLVASEALEKIADEKRPIWDASNMRIRAREALAKIRGEKT